MTQIVFVSKRNKGGGGTQKVNLGGRAPNQEFLGGEMDPGE